MCFLLVSRFHLLFFSALFHHLFFHLYGSLFPSQALSFLSNGFGSETHSEIKRSGFYFTDRWGKTWGERKWSRSVVSDCLCPWTVVYQASLSMGFSRQEYWSGLPFPSPGELPDPGIEPRSPALQTDALPSEPPRMPETWCREEQIK